MIEEQKFEKGKNDDIRAMAREALRLSAEATEGPWRFTVKDCLHFMTSLFIDREGDERGHGLVTSDINQENAELYATDEDMAFIARSRTLLPALAQTVLDTNYQDLQSDLDSYVKEFYQNSKQIKDLVKERDGLKSQLEKTEAALACRIVDEASIVCQREELLRKRAELAEKERDAARRGIEAYRKEYDCHRMDGSKRLNDCHPQCAACAWEREEKENGKM